MLTVNKIICGDVLTELRNLDDESVDVVITSPPYNLKNSTGNGMKDGRGSKWASADKGLREGYSKHNDSMSREDYINWMQEILTECFRVVKSDGAIFFNHKFRVQGGLMEGHPFLEGFNVRQMIIWARSGGFNFNAGYFLPTYEVIYLMPKTARGKNSFKLKKGANKLGDIWRIHQDTKNPHPAPFPVELVDNILSSCDGTTVLDPSEVLEPSESLPSSMDGTTFSLITLRNTVGWLKTELRPQLRNLRKLPKWRNYHDR